MNYERDLLIDKDCLDEEWLKQPNLYMRYAIEAARAVKIRDEAKELLDVARAEIDADIRNHPEKYGLTKVTDSAVSSQILLSEKYKKVQSIYSMTRQETDLISAGLRALEHRKKALENLVQLWIGEYFSTPKDTSKGEVQKQVLDKAADAQRRAINRKRGN